MTFLASHSLKKMHLIWANSLFWSKSPVKSTCTVNAADLQLTWHSYSWAVKMLLPLHNSTMGTDEAGPLLTSYPAVIITSDGSAGCLFHIISSTWTDRTDIEPRKTLTHKCNTLFLQHFEDTASTFERFQFPKNAVRRYLTIVTSCHSLHPQPQLELL